MTRRLPTRLDQAVDRRLARRWARRARQAETASPSRLRSLRARAIALKRELDRLIHVADGRLAAPRGDAIEMPFNADWGGRPDLWRGPLAVPGQAGPASGTRLSEDVALFHDCRRAELAARQIRNRGAEDLAPYGLSIDVFGFEGSFLSVAVDLPAAAASGLQRQSIMQVDATLDLERPLEVFARLNVRHGPNTEQLVQELPIDGRAARAEFDLAYTGINERRVEAIWVDLIFEAPRMNRITLRDVTACRRPRAPM